MQTKNGDNINKKNTSSLNHTVELIPALSDTPNIKLDEPRVVRKRQVVSNREVASEILRGQDKTPTSWWTWSMGMYL